MDKEVAKSGNDGNNNKKNKDFKGKKGESFGRKGGKPGFNKKQNGHRKESWRDKKKKERQEKNLDIIKSDERFSKSIRDPRFRSISKRSAKVEIDKRFSSILNSKKKNAFKSKAKVDKFGRRLKEIKEEEEDLSKFYTMKNDDDVKDDVSDDDEDKKKKKEPSIDENNNDDNSSSSSSSEDEMVEMDEEAMKEFSEDEKEDVDEVEEGHETKRLAAMNMDWTMVKSVDILAMLSSFVPKSGAILKVSVYPSEYGMQKLAEEDAQGPPPEIFSAPAKIVDKNTPAAADDKENEESEEEDDDEIEEEEEEDDDDDNDEDEDDEYSGMSVEELEKLLKKEKESYKKEVFEEEGLVERSESEEEEEEEEEDSEGDNENNKRGTSKKDENDGFNQEELRKYEKNRMKYYFAVIECDSINTANILYENCDGVQLVNSSNAFDLRYIPDDTVFKYPPRDTATEVPANYKPPSRSSIAVDQTNVRLTWDETPQERIALTRQDFKKSGKSDKDLEDDFRAYLASDTSDDDDDDDDESSEDDNSGEKRPKTEEERKEILNRKKEKIRKKYQILLGGLDGNDLGNEADTNEDGETMEITFTPGLSDKAEELLRKKEEDKEMQGLSPWEKYLEKRRRKAEDRKQQKKDEEIAERKASRMKKAGIKTPADEKEEERKRQAELELLMIDEKDSKASGLPSSGVAGGVGGGSEEKEDEKGIAGGKRKKARQMSKKKRREAEEKEESGEFVVNTEDKRFEGLYTSHDFAMDPTHPEFKKTKSTAAIMEKRNKERSKIEEEEEKEARTTAAAVAASKADSKSEVSEVTRLAESIKRRAKEQEQIELVKKRMKKN